jgi:hypothetical protein
MTWLFDSGRVQGELSMANDMTDELVTSKEFQIDQKIEDLIGEIIARSGKGVEDAEEGRKTNLNAIHQIYRLVNDRVRLLVPRLERL